MEPHPNSYQYQPSTHHYVSTPRNNSHQQVDAISSPDYYQPSVDYQPDYQLSADYYYQPQQYNAPSGTMHLQTAVPSSQNYPNSEQYIVASPASAAGDIWPAPPTSDETTFQDYSYSVDYQSQQYGAASGNMHAVPEDQQHYQVLQYIAPSQNYRHSERHSDTVSTSGDIWPAPPTSTAETTFQELVKDQQPPQTSSTSKNVDSEAIDRKAVLNLVKEIVRSPLLDFICEMLSNPVSCKQICAWVPQQKKQGGRAPSLREWAIYDPKTFTAMLNNRFSHQETKSYLQLNRALKVYEMNKDQHKVGRLLRKMPDRRNHFQFFPDMDSC